MKKEMFEFDFVVDNITKKEAEKIMIEIVRLIEKFDGRCGGGYHIVEEGYGGYTDGGGISGT